MTAARRAAPAAVLRVIVSAVPLTVLLSCGKQGPPLPPLRPVPVAPTEVTARRSDTRVHLGWVVPAKNQDAATLVAIDRVEIYARSVPMGSERPTALQILKKDHLVGTVAVRPATAPDAAPSPPVAGAAAVVDTRPAPGEAVVWNETIPAGVAAPLEMTREQKIRREARRSGVLMLHPTGILIRVEPLILPARYYIVVGFVGRRPGAPSEVIAVPMDPGPAAPSVPVVTYTETTLTVTWTTPVAGVPVNLYVADRAGLETASPIEAAPITTATWSKPVEFGVERCFVVRSVKATGPVSVESEAAGPQCETPKDTFAPAAPTGLNGLPYEGAIRLVWDAVAAPDLAGYHVLRGAGTGDTLPLSPLTKTFEPGTSFSDTTARPGAEYTYAVIAVDKAGNMSAQSSRKTITGK